MKKEKIPSIIPILILTLVTVLMWVSFTAYRAFQIPGETGVTDDISKDLNPSLDLSSINQIKSRVILDDSQIPDVIANTTKVSPIPVQTIPSPSAIPTASSKPLP